jgi:hypothetical protein
VNPEERIQIKRIFLPELNAEIPFYHRYIGDETELWLYGSGLGEYTMFLQMGDCFLQLMEENDPGLGRIMMTLGHGQSAFMSFRGDYNVAWVWGVTPDRLAGYFGRLNVRPDLMLCSWDLTRQKAGYYGVPSMPMFSGVNPRVFKPLGLDRSGLGYAGIDNKGEAQKSIVIEPARQRGNFEWISGEKDPLLDIDGYNTWLNSKQIVMGMIHEDRHKTAYIPTRVIETLASGTPLITYEIRDMEEIMGMVYPFQTTSAEETTEIIDMILSDYEHYQMKFEMYSLAVREKHSYTVKLRNLFEELEKL